MRRHVVTYAQGHYRIDGQSVSEMEPLLQTPLDEWLWLQDRIHVAENQGVEVITRGPDGTARLGLHDPTPGMWYEAAAEATVIPERLPRSECADCHDCQRGAPADSGAARSSGTNHRKVELQTKTFAESVKSVWQGRHHEIEASEWCAYCGHNLLESTHVPYVPPPNKKPAAAIVALVLVLFALFAVAVSSDPASETGTRSPSASGSRSPSASPKPSIDTSSLVGLTADEAAIRAQLSGLTVFPRTLDSAAIPAEQHSSWTVSRVQTTQTKVVLYCEAATVPSVIGLTLPEAVDAYGGGPYATWRASGREDGVPDSEYIVIGQSHSGVTVTFQVEVVAPPPPPEPPPPAAPAVQPPPAPAAPPVEQAPANVYYKNCTAAHAAGASNLRRWDPGYRPALDRDNDGIACER